MYNNRTLKEKRSLRFTANKIGITYCLTIIAYIIITAFIPTNKSTLNLHMLVQMLCFFLASFFLIKISPSESKFMILFRKPKKYFSQYIIVGIPLCLLASIITNVISKWLQSRHIYSLQPSILNQPELLIFVVLGAPFVEEFVYRGAILGLLRKYGDGFSIFISAFIFGLTHSNIEQFVYAFLIGLYFGFIVIKTKSLWTSIFLHALMNTFSFISVTSHFAENYTLNYLLGLFQLVITFVAICFFIRCKTLDSDFFSFSSLRRRKTSLSLSERLSAVVLNPGVLLMLFYIIYSFINLGWIES